MSPQDGYALIPTSRLLEILTELTLIRQTQQEILARLARPAQPVISNADRALLETLLPLIGRRVGDSVFTIASLRESTVAAKDQELASALDACSAKALGKLFSRCEGQDIAGYSVQRVAARIWRISNVD
jgi:hypothetical protein